MKTPNNFMKIDSYEDAIIMTLFIASWMCLILFIILEFMVAVKK